MSQEEIVIRETTSEDIPDILKVEKSAFGQEEEATLVSDLLTDETAKPILSLLAFIENKAVGHILFSKVSFENSISGPLMHILAPLAVIPTFQGKGIGGILIKKGLKLLKERGSKIVFVLGHETYYPNYGFIPNANKFGLIAPYPIPEEHANAWMYQFLDKRIGIKGKIKCANQLDKKDYWQE